jgi:hypothetical protein
MHHSFSIRKETTTTLSAWLQGGCNTCLYRTFIHVTRQVYPYQQQDHRNHNYNQHHMYSRLFSTDSSFSLSVTLSSLVPCHASTFTSPQHRSHCHVRQQQAFTTSALTSSSISPDNKTSSNNNSMTTEPQISPDKDTDPATALQSLKQLIDEHGWDLDSAGTGISKTYWFKTYTKCLVSRNCTPFENFRPSIYQQ